MLPQENNKGLDQEMGLQCLSIEYQKQEAWQWAWHPTIFPYPECHGRILLGLEKYR